MSKRTEMRVKGNEFCRLEVELREREEGELELSICGTAGYILTEAQARQESQEFNESWLEESDENMAYIRAHSGIRFRSVKRAAAWIRSVDGEYAGLDVVREDDGKVYICHSSGQIREEIARYFPEVVPYFHWHLNAMRASADGSGWEYEPLPQDVIDWAMGIGDRQTFNNSYVYREFSKEVKGSWWYGVELPAWLRAFDCRATDAEIAPKSPWGTSLWGSERVEVDLGLRSEGVYNATTPVSCSTYLDARTASDADLSKQVADMVKAATELYTEYQAAQHKPGNGGSCLYCPVAIVMSNYGWSVVSDQRQCKIRPFSR